jgi:DNA-directed RNA polymerase delta subunit
MKIRKMDLEELEKLSYLDIAYYLIKEDKKVKTTVELLKEICSLLNFDDNDYKNMIGDFYTSLTVDKRFLLLENAKWDLKENHSVKTVIEDELDELDGIDITEEIEEETDEEDEEEKDDESIDEEDEEEPDDELDEIEDLTIIDEESPDEEVEE